jgi:predicted acetyltransferase
MFPANQQPPRSEASLPPGVEVLPAAREHEPVLANMLELYAYDFSEVCDLQLWPDGRYHYPALPLYWQEKTRFPFLVKAGGHLAGFVLVSSGSLISGDPQVWDMAEFFVMRRYRRQGIGAAVAQEIWRRFPGPWDVRVLESNQPAQAFWQATLHAFAGSPAAPVSVEQGGKQRRVFSFVSSDAGGAPSFRSPGIAGQADKEARE